MSKTFIHFPSTTTPKIEVEEIATVTAVLSLVIDAAMLVAISAAAVDTTILIAVPAAAGDATIEVKIMITTLIETMSRIGCLLGNSDHMP